MFRLAAIAEAVGWTLLISGILIGKYLMPTNDIAVQLAGHTHGILFLLYIVAAVVMYPSQRWSRWRTLIAIVASVPPYGTLIFEQWEAHRRRRVVVGRHALLATYSLLVKANEASLI